MKLSTWLKLLRSSSLLLYLLILLVLLSGLFTTKNYLIAGVISYNTLYWFHTFLLPLILIPVLYVHTLAGLIIGFKRRNIKKVVLFVTSILWTIIFVAIFIAIILPRPQVAITNSTTSTSNIKNLAYENITLTLDEIAKHNKINDCWIIVENKVYDITPYIQYHPGGVDNIAMYCGRNATEGFNSKNQVPAVPHSQAAWELLQQYYLGKVGEKISYSINATKTNTTIAKIEETIKKTYPDYEIVSIKPEGAGYEVKLKKGFFTKEISVGLDGQIYTEEWE